MRRVRSRTGYWGAQLHPARGSTDINRSQQGFSLLEVLVAFVVLALAMGVLMQIFSGGLQNATRASETQQAVLLAQSKLAEVGAGLPLQAGDNGGEFDDSYRWQVSIRPYQDVSGDAGAPFTPLGVKLLEVDVRVLWGDTDAPRSVELKTLRLANKVAL